MESNGVPREALQEAQSAKPVALAGRTDLRKIPLVTIDPEDARDHDDAVWRRRIPIRQTKAAMSSWSPSPMSPIT